MIEWLKRLWYGSCEFCDDILPENPALVLLKHADGTAHLKICGNCEQWVDNRTLDLDEAGTLGYVNFDYRDIDE
jgi:hypothetical protein